MEDDKKPLKLTLVQAGAVDPSSGAVTRLRSLGFPVRAIRVEEMFIEVPEQPQTSPPREPKL